jgi:CRP/FNR family cyclic AMP-dependent transcriptional regulator
VGDPADALHLVESGHLAVRVGLVSGSTAALNILGAGDYFGEMALLRADHRPDLAQVSEQRLVS